MTQSIPIACDITAVLPSIREQTGAALPEISHSVQQFRELGNGYP